MSLQSRNYSLLLLNHCVFLSPFQKNFLNEKIEHASSQIKKRCLSPCELRALAKLHYLRVWMHPGQSRKFSINPSISTIYYTPMHGLNLCTQKEKNPEKKTRINFLNSIVILLNPLYVISPTCY